MGSEMCIRDSLLFKIISFLEIALVFSTGNKSFLILASFKEFFSSASLLVKITEDFSKEVPNDENIGLVYTGCGVGIDAFGSPICAQAILPPISIISGFAPKNAGSHKTKSARLFFQYFQYVLKFHEQLQD